MLPQEKEGEYLGVLFTGDGKTEREMDRRVGAAPAVLWTIVDQMERSLEAKLSI